MASPPQPGVLTAPDLLEKRLSSIVDAELPESIHLLIRLRWLAGLGVLVVTLSVGPLFKVLAPIAPLLAIGACILIYNLAFFLWERRLRQAQSPVKMFKPLAVYQMVLDWIAMTLLIHFSGGVESPAVYFFLFHIVLASIFFTRRLAFAFTAFALVLFYGGTTLEYFSLIPHVTILGYMQHPMYQNPLFMLGMLAFFGSSGIFVTFLVTNISDSLRRREVEVVELSESLRQVTSRLQALNESARTINSTLELRQVLNRLVQTTAEVLGVRACSIRLLDKSGQRLESVAAYGLSQAYMNKGPIELANSPLDRQVLSGSVVNIPDAAQSSLLQYPEWVTGEGFRSVLSAPLLGKSKALGILRAYSEDKDHFTQSDESFLVAIAAQGSIAIENAMAYQAIEALENTKSEFYRTFSHELRSPVSVVRSLLKNITDGYTGEITPQQRDLLERAIRRIDFLSEMIDDILDLAAGRTEDRSAQAAEAIPLQLVLERVVKRFEVPAQEKGLTLEWQDRSGEAETRVMATPDGLDRVFNNLISNAVKYTLHGGRVTVTLARTGEEACVTVEDTGIGIPEEALSQLFTEFYRAPNAKAIESKGTGLGLAIVKDTVANFGGKIEVQSKLGEGSRFTVTFPVVKK